MRFVVWNLKPVFSCLLAMGLGACGTPVLSPGQRLDDADRAALEQAAQKALEVNKDGQGLNWANPKTGHVGTVMPTRTYKSDTGQPCRDYQQTVTVEGSTEFTTGSRCRSADGAWSVVRRPRPFYGYDPYFDDPFWRPYGYPFGYPYGYSYGYPFHRPYSRYGYPYNW